MSNRTYTEEEVARLIKRAAELETERSATHSASSQRAGLTLDELATIAAEAGIDPESVRLAAAEMEQSAAGEKKTGSSEVRGTELVTERWVDGELTDDIAGDIIAELKHRYDTNMSSFSGVAAYDGFGQGKIQKTGQSIEWKHLDVNGIFETRVLLQPRGNRLRIRISKRSPWGGGWSLGMDGMSGYVSTGAPFVVMFAVLFVFFADAPFLLNLFAIIAALGAAALFIHNIKKHPGKKQANNKHTREIEDLADEIASHITETVPNQKKKNRSFINIERSEERDLGREEMSKRRSERESG